MFLASKHCDNIESINTKQKGSKIWLLVLLFSKPNNIFTIVARPWRADSAFTQSQPQFVENFKVSLAYIIYRSEIIFKDSIFSKLMMLLQTMLFFSRSIRKGKKWDEIGLGKRSKSSHVCRPSTMFFKL
jgi:hypothetical protein